jgi:integrase
MMAHMPRPRPPFLHRETTRHGKVVWFVRIGKGPRTRIRAEYGTADFDAAYKAAIDGEAVTAPGKAGNGTLEWLIDRYRDSAAWLVLSLATRRQRENIFKGAIATAGRKPYRLIRQETIKVGKKRREHTPAQARNFLDAMRGLFRWAVGADHLKSDPTAGVENPPRPKGPGFVKWSEQEVDRYQSYWPIGTRQRVWLDVLLYTGLRRGDAVLLGRQHVRDGMATLATEKGGETIVVTIPILPVLQATLDAGPTGDLAFICGERGLPLTKESFGNLFKAACVEAGVVGKKKAAHGLRKVGATRAAENGATDKELDALFGWVGGNTSKIYTREADRKRLAIGAAGKLARNETATSIPAPGLPVRAGIKKAE